MLTLQFILLPSRLCEGDPSDERFGAGGRIVRIDRERERGEILRSLPIDLPEVFDDVATLGDPLAELAASRAQDDIGNGAGLLAFADRANPCRRIPDVAD